MQFGAGKKSYRSYHLVVAAAGGVNTFARVAEFFGKDKLDLRVHIFHIVGNGEFAIAGGLVNIFKFGLQFCIVVFAQQTALREHLCVSHTAESIIFGEIKIHLAVFADSKSVYKFGGIKTFVPKFHCI